jgi:hypothetical protein
MIASTEIDSSRPEVDEAARAIDIMWAVSDQLFLASPAETKAEKSLAAPPVDDSNQESHIQFSLPAQLNNYSLPWETD